MRAAETPCRSRFYAVYLHQLWRRHRCGIWTSTGPLHARHLRLRRLPQEAWGQAFENYVRSMLTTRLVWLVGGRVWRAWQRHTGAQLSRAILEFILSVLPQTDGPRGSRWHRDLCQRPGVHARHLRLRRLPQEAFTFETEPHGRAAVPRDPGVHTVGRRQTGHVAPGGTEISARGQAYSLGLSSKNSAIGVIGVSPTPIALSK